MENISDFDFYIKFSKPLILNLPQINDRVLAAAWVKKLMGDTTTEEKIKLDYLKLLLFVLQRKRLAPPFTQHPNAVETLTPFPADQTLVDVAKHIIEKENEEKREKEKKKRKGEGGDYPPYVSDFSADLLEYVAVQHIENFGVHGYYAISKAPLNSWYRVDKHLLPKAAKSMLEVSPGSPPVIGTISSPTLGERPISPPPPSPPKTPEAPKTPEQELVATETPPAEPEPAPAPTPSPSPRRRESPKRSTLGATPPSRPIGVISPPYEERSPPTWGSNLLEVKDILPDEVAEAQPFTSSPEATEVLWSSPGTQFFDMAGGLEDEFDDFGDVADMPSFLDESLAFEAGTPGRYHSAASLPYATPPVPWVTPRPADRDTPPARPKKVKKVAPQARPTRASMLLQKKKEAQLKPPPPPPEKPKKKKGPVIRKPVQKVPSATEVEEVEEAPTTSTESMKKKSLIKKPSKTKGKLKGKKPSAQAVEQAIAAAAAASAAAAEESITQIVAGTSPIGEPAYRGFEETDEMGTHLEEYRQLLREVEAQYQQQRGEYDQRYAPPRQSVAQAPVRRQIPRPKRSLSGIARRVSTKIPKAHDASVTLDQSIHISEEARQILDVVAQSPSPAGTQPGRSSLRSPAPRLPPIADDEDVGESEVPEEEGEAGEEEVTALYETLKSYPGPGKDRAVAEAFNELVKTAVEMSPIGEEAEEEYEGEYDMEALEALQAEGGLDVGEADLNVANISGLGAAGMDEALGMLEAQAGPVNMLVAESSLAAEDQAAGVTVLETEAVPAGFDEDDFEAMEKMVEAQMIQSGQDPHARAKPKKMSKRKLKAGRKAYLDVHRKVEAQMEQLEGEEERKRDIMEQMEDAYRRLQPETAPAQRTPPMFSKHKAIRDLAAGLYQQGEYAAASEGEEFVPGTQFFAEPEDERVKAARELFPSLDIEEEGVDIWQEEAPDVEGSPGTRIQEKSELDKMFDELMKSSPAMAGVPVTTPHPSVCPRRPRDIAKLLEEATSPPHDINVSITPPDSPTDAFGLPHMTASPLRPLSERVAERERRRVTTPQVPDIRIQGPTPPTPPSPPFVDIEDDVYQTERPEDFAPIESPEPYYYESPQPVHHPLRRVTPVDPALAAQVSPPNKRWLDERDELRRKLFGSPKTPTIFDIPAISPIRGETPPRLASPVRSPLSPAIDAAALRQEIRRNAPILPQRRDEIQVGPTGKHTVKRYSHRPVGMSAIQEAPSQELLTQDEIEFQDFLRQFKKRRRGREVFKLPYKKRRVLVHRHAPPPRVPTIEEVEEPSPPRTRPNVWDLPDIFDRVTAESPPQDYEELLSPWTVRDLSPGMRAMLGVPDTPPPFPEIPYGPSPRSRFPVEGSGPRRRELRKKLKKRRLDFSVPQTTDESQVQVEEVEAEVVDDRYLFPEIDELGLELEPDVVKRIHGLLDTPPRPEEGMKTPPVHVLSLETEPEDLAEVLETTPPSPLSHPDTMSEVVEKVKKHVPLPKPKRRRRSIRDTMAWRYQQLGEVPHEQPYEERAAEIHDEMEAQVEAEIAAREAEERARLYSHLDEPVPGDLPSPLRPQKPVPFYETPPELRRVPRVSPKREMRIMPSQFRDVLRHEEMPFLVSPEESPQQVTPVLKYHKKGVKTHDGVKVEEEEEDIFLTTSSAGLLTEEMPEVFESPVSPVKTAEDIERLAMEQYAQLLTPPRRAERSPDRDERFQIDPRVMKSVERMAALRHIEMPPMPRRVQVPLFDSPELEQMGFEERLFADPNLQAVELVAGPPPYGFELEPEISELDLAEAGPSTRPDAVEFQYEEKVVEAAKPPKKTVSKGKVKGKSKIKGKGKAPLPKPEETAPPPKPREPKKLKRPPMRLVKKSAKKKAPPKPKPPVEIEYDMDALEELGLTAADLKQLDLNDLDVDVEEMMPTGPVIPRAPILTSPVVEQLPLRIRPRSPEHPPIEHLEQMYETLKTTEAKMHRRPMRVQGKYLPTTYRRMPQKLSQVAETAEEHRTSFPLKWDLKWDLSPQSRVDRKAPEVQVPLSPLKESRYHFEEVQLEEPPPVQREDMLPYVFDEIEAQMPSWHMPSADLNLGLDYEEPPTDLVPGGGPDIFERLEEVEESFAEPGDEESVEEEFEDFAADISTEEMPEELYHSPYYSPSPIKRVKTPQPPLPREFFLDEEDAPMDLYATPPQMPTPPRPLSPSPSPGEWQRLKTELSAREIYDPEKDETKRSVKIYGKVRKTGAKKPSLQAVGELRSPVPKVIAPLSPGRRVQRGMAVAPGTQIAAKTYDTSTPSPRSLAARLQAYQYEPTSPSVGVVGSRSPRLSPVFETREHFETAKTPARLVPPPVAVPPGYQLSESSPPPPLFFSPPERINAVDEGDVWYESSPEAISPSFMYTSPEQMAPTSEGWTPQILESWTPQVMHRTSPKRSPGIWAAPAAAEVSPPFGRSPSPPLLMSPTAFAAYAPPRKSPISPSTPPRGQTVQATKTSQAAAFSPRALTVDPYYRMVIPSPERPQRYQPPVRLGPYTMHELPEPYTQPKKSVTPSPKREKAPQRQLIRRRLDFDEEPPSPEQPHVTVLSVEAAPSPSGVQASPGRSQVSPSAVPQGPTVIEEEEEIEIVTSPTPSSPPFFERSPFTQEIPEHLRNFKWMDERF